MLAPMTAAEQNQTTTRRRAPAMSPEERRAMIIQTAIPLIAEYGAAVTTAKVARAAGIGEGTIFRVFADKDELLQACMAEALSPSTRSASSTRSTCPSRCPTGSPRRPRHCRRTWPGWVRSAGSLGHRGGGKHPGTVRGAGRSESTTRLRSALAELLEPDKATLRRPPEQIAALFFGLLFTQPRTDDEPDLTSQELVELFLHGAQSGGAE